MRRGRKYAEFTAAEKRVAWDAYVELVTRTATVPLRQDAWLRSSMSSLHALVGKLRAALISAGPDCSPLYRPENAATMTSAVIRVLREFLTRWHPALDSWETGSPLSNFSGYVERERAWPDYERCVADLREVQAAMRTAAELFGNIAGGDLMQGACRA